MKQTLEELTLIPGVLGGYILHAKQGVSTHNLPDSFKQENLADINRQLLKIFSASRMSLKAMKDLSLHYEGLVLYLRQVAEQLFLIAVCDPTVNTNVLSMTVRLAIEEMDPLELQASAAPPAQKTPEKPKVETPAEPALTIGTIRETGHLVADLQAVEDALAAVMGPMAEMILDDAIEEWFETSLPAYSSLAVLIRIICREIGDAAKVRVFQTALSNYDQN